MIRRWSRLTQLTFSSDQYSKIHFRFKFKSFRKAIIFKKFFTLYSKILRRHYSRMKHSYNWLIYTQIWQHWIKDFLKLKISTRFFYIKNFNPLEYFSYDPYRLNSKQQKLVGSFYQLSCGLPKSLFLWNFFLRPSLTGSSYVSFFNPNSYLHFSYFLQSPSLLKEVTAFPLPLLFLNEQNLANLKFIDKLSPTFDNFNTLFNELFVVILQITNEVYKFTTYLWLNIVFSQI
jgi:hypothetical protein